MAIDCKNIHWVSEGWKGTKDLSEFWDWSLKIAYALLFKKKKKSSEDQWKI